MGLIVHRLVLVLLCVYLAGLFCATGAASPVADADTQGLRPGSGHGGWFPPTDEAVQVSAIDADTWLIKSSKPVFFTVESAESLDAEEPRAFAVDFRVQVGVGANVRPELVCFDANGSEIPVPPTEIHPHATPEWQEMRRVFPVQPGTASVRARLRARGLGEIRVGRPNFGPVRVDPYETGALISFPNPYIRRGVLLESNFGVVNEQLISGEDRDGDGKWAIITRDLDDLTRPAGKGEDWRSGFEFPVNEMLWSDGVVLKSDSVIEDREPDVGSALHFRMKGHEGPYQVILSDPGRAVAVSTDGRTWRRYEGGAEITLGELSVADGVVELWLDACYRDHVSAGPVYFDYVRIQRVEMAPTPREITRCIIAFVGRCARTPKYRVNVDAAGRAANHFERQVIITK